MRCWRSCIRCARASLYGLGLERALLPVVKPVSGLAKEEQREDIDLRELGVAAQGECWGADRAADRHVCLVLRQGVAGHDVEAGVDRGSPGERHLSPLEAELAPIEDVPATHRLETAGQGDLFPRLFAHMDLSHDLKGAFI